MKRLTVILTFQFHSQHHYDQGFSADLSPHLFEQTQGLVSDLKGKKTKCINSNILPNVPF